MDPKNTILIIDDKENLHYLKYSFKEENYLVRASTEPLFV